MRVPPEVLDHIVVELASASERFQYGHQPNTLSALVQLCQVDRTAYTIASPHLYSTVVIRDAHQLSLFNRTVSSPSLNLRRHAKSISLHDFPDALTAPYVTVLIELLHSISPYLRRLVLSRALRRLRPEDDTHALRPALRAALENCTLLEEFASVQCELYLDDNFPHTYVCWPYWISLNRLALHNPLINQDFLAFIGALPHLTHLAADNPDWEEGVGDMTLTTLLFEFSNPKLKRVLLTDHRLRPANEKTNMPVSRYIGSIRGLELVYIVLWYPDDDWNLEKPVDDGCWFSDHLDTGTLWEIQPNTID